MRWVGPRNEVRLVKRRNFSFPILSFLVRNSRPGFKNRQCDPVFLKGPCTEYCTIRTYVCTYTVQECSIFLLQNFHPPSTPMFGLEMYRFFSYIQKMQPYSLLPINLLLLSLVTAAPAPAPAPAPDITYNPTKEASCLVKWDIQTNRDITEHYAMTEHYEVTGRCMFSGSVDTLCREGYRAPGFCPGGKYINPIFPLLSSSFLSCSYKKNIANELTISLRLDI